MTEIEIISAIVFVLVLLILAQVFTVGKKIIEPLKLIYDEKQKIDANDVKRQKIEEQIDKMLKDERFMLVAQTKILDHLITGNGITEMKKTKKEILEYLEDNI